MRANIYVDGFNLYYGSVRRYPRLKWLDIAQMCRILLPDIEINRIRYFAARINGWPHDTDAPHRQDIYFRALRTISSLTIHLGRFSTRRVMMPSDSITYLEGKHTPEVVPVIRTEEKRTDVNLATYLLVDCFDDDFDEAVIISNDSDLTLPVETIIEKFGKPVGMINPHPVSRLSSELVRATTHQIRSINRSVLARSQFPPILTDDKGEFHRPSRWR